jgi:REP element-mobilizing transposase RayT
MARPLRIEFPGAVYHVTSRGDRREPIFVDDEDRRALLEVVGQALSRFDAQMLAYCLMGNHYHFVLHTRRANLSMLMRHVNGVYTQAFNRRHGKVGHLFQGRFKAILVDRDAYLLEVCRYVELNPVRARSVRQPEAWPWSSYRAHVGLAEAPQWLDVEGLHGYVLGCPVTSAADHRRAANRYAELVAVADGARLCGSTGSGLAFCLLQV